MSRDVSIDYKNLLGMDRLELSDEYKAAYGGLTVLKEWTRGDIIWRIVRQRYPESNWDDLVREHGLPDVFDKRINRLAEYSDNPNTRLRKALTDQACGVCKLYFVSLDKHVCVKPGQVGDLIMSDFALKMYEAFQQKYWEMLAKDRGSAYSYRTAYGVMLAQYPGHWDELVKKPGLIEHLKRSTIYDDGGWGNEDPDRRRPDAVVNKLQEPVEEPVPIDKMLAMILDELREIRKKL